MCLYYYFFFSQTHLPVDTMGAMALSGCSSAVPRLDEHPVYCAKYRCSEAPEHHGRRGVRSSALAWVLQL